MKPTNDQIKEFFVSWGLAPTLEPEFGDLMNGDGSCDINQKSFEKMLVEAEKMYGREFMDTVRENVESTDGDYYVSVDMWEDMYDAH